MQLVIDQPHLVDTLSYRVFAEKLLPQDRVRITVTVTALVSSQYRDQESLLDEIRAVLNDFIRTDWLFSRIERETDAVGYERVRLKALARVPAGENYNLEERARRASHEGLSLSDPKPDYALPRETVTETVQALREQILEEVARNIEGYNRATGRLWRLGHIEFGVPSEDDVLARMRSAKGAYRGEADDAQVYTLGGIGLTSAERVSLIAEVVLKSAAQAASGYQYALTCGEANRTAA